MRITAQFDGTTLKFCPSGEIDHHSARELMTALEEKIALGAPRDCVMDLSRVSFMDSSGIAVILKLYRLLNSTGGRLWIENVREQPLRVLDASGIDRLIRITAMSSAAK